MQNDSSCEVKVAAINGEHDSGSTDLTSYWSLHVIHIIMFVSKAYRNNKMYCLPHVALMPVWAQENSWIFYPALGRIGWLTPTLQELLLWALQHEEEPSVRIAACEALKVLGVKGPELQNLLQERFSLEANAQVHRSELQISVHRLKKKSIVLSGK